MVVVAAAAAAAVQTVIDGKAVVTFLGLYSALCQHLLQVWRILFVGWYAVSYFVTNYLLVNATGACEKCSGFEGDSQTNNNMPSKQHIITQDCIWTRFQPACNPPGIQTDSGMFCHKHSISSLAR